MAECGLRQRRTYARRRDDILCGERFGIQPGNANEAAGDWRTQEGHQAIRTSTR